MIVNIGYVGNNDGFSIEMKREVTQERAFQNMLASTAFGLKKT